MNYYRSRSTKPRDQTRTNTQSDKIASQVHWFVGSGVNLSTHAARIQNMGFIHAQYIYMQVLLILIFTGKYDPLAERHPAKRLIDLGSILQPQDGDWLNKKMCFNLSLAWAHEYELHNLDSLVDLEYIFIVGDIKI